MVRTWHRTQSLARQTTASTSYSDLLDLTFTPTPSTNYYLLWSAQLDVNANANGRHRLRDDTAGLNLANPIHRSPNAAEIMSTGGIARWTSGVSPGPQTFSVEHSVDTASIVLGSSNAYLMAITADAVDQYAENTGNSSTNSSTLSDKTTLSFTPASAGDYLILCSCEINGFIPASTDGVGRVLLDVNGTQFFDTLDGYFAQTNSQFASWCHGAVVNWTAAPQVVKIRYASSNNTTTAQIRQARILAIRLDSLHAGYTAQSNTRQSTTALSPQAAAGTTFTAHNRDYLFIGTALIDHFTSISTMEARVNWSGTTRSAFKRRQVGPGSRRASFLALGYDSLPAGSQTVSIDWWCTSSHTAGITDAFIGAFLLDVVDIENARAVGDFRVVRPCAGRGDRGGDDCAGWCRGTYGSRSGRQRECFLGCPGGRLLACRLRSRPRHRRGGATQFVGRGHGLLGAAGGGRHGDPQRRGGNDAAHS